jgi:orotate phosphoribosyltransferase
MNFRNIRDLSQDIMNWELPADFDVIVGIPRSGLLAANILSLYRNLPLATVEGFLRGELIKGGYRASDVGGDFLRDHRNILVVDDSLMTGNQIAGVRKSIAPLEGYHLIRYAAVYIQPGNERLVDFFCEVLPAPRVFAWIVMHHSILEDSCVDIDGVLCRDPSEVENDDGARYTKFLASVTPRFCPKQRIKCLVTCRLEKYRRLTEEWLAKYGIIYDRLAMMDFPSKDARVRSGSHAAFKASIFRKMSAELFIESSYEQAVEIARLSGGGVLCTETMELVQPPVIRGFIRQKAKPIRLLREDPAGFVRKVKARLLKGFPSNQKNCDHL